MSRRGEWIAITIILLAAAALRLWALGEVPPGLAHDEVANWLIARDILSGNHAVYFTAAYGHEPLYQYVQAATVALFGDHWLGLRYPSAALGVLGVAATYVLIRRLFGRSTALLACGWLAVSFWPLFYARVALRAIALPLTASLSAYFLFRAINLPGDQPANRPADQPTGVTDWLLAGLFFGLSLYTYMAARILPFILVAFLFYVILFCSSSVVPWSRLLLFFLTAALVSTPLVGWLATHPGAEFRIAEVQRPLTHLLEGDPSLVWQNFVANLKFFTISGDPWPRQNMPGRPIFADPASAALFYAGLLIALWRWRTPRYGLLLIWLLGSLAPSVATSVAPSSIRDILGLVVVFVYPALAVVEAHRFLQSWSQPGRAHKTLLAVVRGALIVVPLALTGYLTVRDYFLAWPQNEVVRFDYQSELTAVAQRLDELPAGTPVAVAGLSVHSMDGPGLDLAARRDLRNVRLCDTRETLVVPAGRDARLFIPQVVPLDADLRERLIAWGAVQAADPQGAFISYGLASDEAMRPHLQRLETAIALPDGTPVPPPVSFGGQLSFLRYEWTGQDFAAGGAPSLLTYWRVESPPAGPLKLFVHLLGESGAALAQHDGLGSPPRGWAKGDLIVQKHVLPIPPDISPGLYKLQLGVYNAPAGPRLSVDSVDGIDRLFLAPVEIQAR